MDEQPVEEVVTRPRRRGEPRPPDPAPEPGPVQQVDPIQPVDEHEHEHDHQVGLLGPVQDEPEHGGAVEQPEPLPEPVPEPPAPLAAQLPAQPVAEPTRMCSFCLTQQPLSQLDQLAPLMLACRDAAGCAERAASSGYYPQSERDLERQIADHENRQGALR